MSDDSQRNLPPTARRRADFRRQGRVAVSPLPGAAVVLLILAVALPSLGLRIVELLKTELADALQNPRDEALTVAGVTADLRRTTLGLGFRLAPWLVAILALVGLQGLLQTRFVWNWQLLAADWGRLSPLRGIGLWNWADVLRRGVRIFLLLGVAVGCIWGVGQQTLVGPMPQGQPHDLPQLTARWGELACQSVWRIALLTSLISVADHAWEWWRLERALRMTPAEMREELRQTEGHPANRSLAQKTRAAARDRLETRVSPASSPANALSSDAQTLS